MAKNTAMALARTSSGKISETVRYPAEAPAEAQKKITDQHSVWVTAFSVPALSGNDRPADGRCDHREHGNSQREKASGGSGSPVILYTCGSAANELWTHNSRGEYVLKARGGTLCLDDPADSTRNGTQLIVSTCKNSANQHWSLP